MIPSNCLRSILETDDEKYYKISRLGEKDEHCFGASLWKC